MPKNGGAPPPPARNAPPPLIAGIDIGGTSTKLAIIDPSAVAEDPEEGVLGRVKSDTDAHDGADAALDALDDLLDRACEEAEVERGRLAAIGIAVAGAVDHLEGVVLNAVNLRWSDLPLARLVRERLDLPAIVENDVRAAVYGEKLAGAARDSRNAFGVWVGTGIGGGLILNDELFYGSYGTAGEFGRGVVLPWTPPGEGSLEQVCSRTGMAESLVRLLRSNRTSALEMPPDNDPREIRSKDIAKAYKGDDELVAEVVDHAAQVLGIAIAGVVTLLSLDRVVLGGGFVDALGSKYVKRVQETVRKAVFPDECREVKVAKSELGDDAGPVGAALLAARRLGVRTRAATV